MDEIIEKWSDRGFKDEVMEYIQMDIIELKEEATKCKRLENKYLIKATTLEECGAVDMAVKESNNYGNLWLLISEIITEKLYN